MIYLIFLFCLIRNLNLICFFLVTTSSMVIFLAAFTTTLIDPRPSCPDKGDCPGADPNYLVLIPFSLLGLGYSVYAAAMWGCIPYTVRPNLVATAFGICTSIQNIGLSTSPLAVGWI